MHSGWVCIIDLNVSFSSWAIYIHLNHRAVETWRDVWKSSGPHHPAKQGHLQMHRILSKQFFNICKEGDSTASGQPVTVLTHPQSKCFLIFRWNILCFSLCPLLSILSLSTEHQWEEPVSTLSAHSLHTQGWEIPWASSSLGWTVPILPTFLYT